MSKPSKKKNKRVEKCGKWKCAVITDDEEECTYCNIWYHALCSGLNRKEFRDATSNASIPYSFVQCAKDKKSHHSNVTSNLPPVNKEYTEIIERLKVLDILPEIEKSLKFVTDQYDVLSQKQNTLS